MTKPESTRFTASSIAHKYNQYSNKYISHIDYIRSSTPLIQTDQDDLLRALSNQTNYTINLSVFHLYSAYYCGICETVLVLILFTLAIITCAGSRKY